MTIESIYYSWAKKRFVIRNKITPKTIGNQIESLFVIRLRTHSLKPVKTEPQENQNQTEPV